MSWFTAAAVLLALAALCALALTRHRHKMELASLDRLLDAALAGDFSPDTFDESQVSKLVAKLHRFVTAAKLKRGQLEAEQARVHALISDISHQTKTPVANMLLYAELLAEQPELMEPSRAMAAHMCAGAEKLSFLVGALVKSSRLESGIIRIQPRRHDLYSVAAEAAAQCLPKARKKGITLALPEKNRDISAQCDPKWCAEAVYNILDNAVKNTPEGGEITVSFHDYELFACIRVADTGRGIASADLPKIFTRFFRADPGQEGSGLGLYLSREIVTRCGGYIRAESPSAGGAVFSVYLSKL